MRCTYSNGIRQLDFAFVNDVDIIQELPIEGEIFSTIGLNSCSGDLVWDKSDTTHLACKYKSMEARN